LKTFATVVLLLFSICVAAQDEKTIAALTVVVIDADSGKPIPNKKVRLDFPAEHAHPNIVAAGAVIDAVTGKDGVATFHLLAQTAPKMMIMLAVGNWTQCSPYEYSLATVLSSGIITKNRCHAAVQTHLLAKPGEVVVFTRRITFSEKLKRFPG
jgi:hypothetical protein